jgi:hypothetical protein
MTLKEESILQRQMAINGVIQERPRYERSE